MLRPCGRLCLRRMATGSATPPANSSCKPGNTEIYWESQTEGQRTLSGFDWGQSNPVGTGHWVVSEFRDSRVIFKRNREYWGNSAWMSEFRLDFVDDQATQLTRWHEGSADIVWPVEPRVLEQISDRPGTVYAAETTRTIFAAFNFNNPTRTNPALLSDIRIRKALSLGIDRNRYLANCLPAFSGRICPEPFCNQIYCWRDQQSRVRS